MPLSRPTRRQARDSRFPLALPALAPATKPLLAPPTPAARKMAVREGSCDETPLGLLFWALCSTMRTDSAPHDHHASTCASAASVWGSQKVISMDWYIALAVESATRACSRWPV